MVELVEIVEKEDDEVDEEGDEEVDEEGDEANWEVEANG